MADQPQQAIGANHWNLSPVETLHSIRVERIPGRDGPDFYAVCSCGKWESSPTSSEAHAQQVTCPIAEAEAEGARNIAWRGRVVGRVVG